MAAPCLLWINFRGEKCKPRERKRERDQHASRIYNEREGQNQRGILSLQRLLQRARCISYTSREESRDLSISVTSSFVVVGTRADEVKPVVYLFIEYNYLLSSG